MAADPGSSVGSSTGSYNAWMDNIADKNASMMAKQMETNLKMGEDKAKKDTVDLLVKSMTANKPAQIVQ